jgi:hypothetical protein
VISGLGVAGLLALAGCSDDADATDSGSTEPPTTAPASDDEPTTPAPTTEPAAETATTAPPLTEPEVIAGSVSFEIVNDIASEPSTGRFVVSVGADTLGCDEGRFFGSVDRNLWTMTCESGSRSGEIKMAFEPVLGEDETFTGTWTIESGTGDFETLSGEGELESVRDVATLTITGTRSGEIRFDGGAG